MWRLEFELRLTSIRILYKMGGGAKYAYPKYVWSPAGGWWCNPKGWKGNTAIMAGAGLLVAGAIANFSMSRERRPVPPTRHILSQSWCDWTKVDDPSYAKAHGSAGH
eukprot:gene12972-16224_t